MAVYFQLQRECWIAQEEKQKTDSRLYFTGIAERPFLSVSVSYLSLVALLGFTCSLLNVDVTSSAFYTQTVDLTDCHSIEFVATYGRCKHSFERLRNSTDCTERV